MVRTLPWASENINFAFIYPLFGKTTCVLRVVVLPSDPVQFKDKCLSELEGNSLLISTDAEKLFWQRCSKTGPNHNTTTGMFHNFFPLSKTCTCHLHCRLYQFVAKCFFRQPSGLSVWCLAYCKWAAMFSSSVSALTALTSTQFLVSGWAALQS